MAEKGTVIKSTGSRYRVLTGAGSVVDCCMRGRLRMSETRKTNPVAVGDEVLFETDAKTGIGIITGVLDRRNYVLRKSSNLSRHSQVIAANVDLALLMITVKMPETPVEFIDRFLVSAGAYGVPAVILINKVDLYSADDMERMRFLESMYGEAGYRTMHFSVTSGFDPAPFVDIMKGRISLVSGNSGTGKSSLLNALNPQLRIRTGKISDYHLQGKHITTYPEMYAMPFGGFAIDTPGIRGFGVVDLERNEISHFFPEIFRASKRCRFGRCLHIDEPGCAVKEAVADGAINPLRYRSYINILEADDRKYR